jgi:hypothetical protein
VTPSRARSLAAALGRWAEDEYSGTGPEAIRWAMAKAGNLVVELVRLEAAARAHWDLPDRPFARTSGFCLHARGCFVMSGAALAGRPLTRSQAEAFLRERHEHRRCTMCQPDIPEALWVRVVSAGGQVRWRLAEDVSPPGGML